MQENLTILLVASHAFLAINRFEVVTYDITMTENNK